MKEVVLLILGAVVGVIAQTLYNSAAVRVARLRLARRLRISRKGDDSLTHSRNIIQIYRSLDLDEALYSTHAVRPSSPLPILLCTDRAFEGTVQPQDDELMSLDFPDIVHLPVDDRLVEQKRSQGVKLWDGAVLYVKEVQHTDPVRPRLSVGVCNYYAYVTLAQRLRREIGGRGRKRPILDNFRSFPEALSGNVGPITLAATVTSVFETEDRRRVVALQRRSSSVVNAHGMVGVAPIFGMESNVSDANRSRYGLMTYNFLKEFLEEFFDLEDLIRAASEPRADVDWIFHLPNAAELTRQVDSGEVLLKCTGMGIDLSDGSLTIALLAHFTDPGYLKLVKVNATGSWESERATRARPAIEFVSIDDPRLNELATIESMDPSSIFSLDLAMTHLQDSQA